VYERADTLVYKSRRRNPRIDRRIYQIADDGTQELIEELECTKEPTLWHTRADDGTQESIEESIK